MNEKTNLFQEAKTSHRLLNGFLAAILLLVMLMGGQIIGQLVMAFIIGLGMRATNTREISELVMGFMLLLSFAVPLLLCFLWVKTAEKRSLTSLGLDKNKAFTKFSKGFGIGLLLFTAVTLLMWLTGVTSLEKSIGMGLKSIPAILILLPAWILQSSTEEILSRGWFMHLVGAKHKPIIGLVASSVTFGLIHLGNPGVGPIAVLNIVLVGFMFGLYVIYTGDLWGACGIHAAWNFAQGNIFGFRVSGIDLSAYSLVKFSSQGSEFLTGGEFGPEASIFATVVIGVALVILILKLRKTN